MGELTKAVTVWQNIEVRKKSRAVSTQIVEKKRQKTLLCKNKVQNIWCFISFALFAFSFFKTTSLTLGWRSYRRFRYLCVTCVTLGLSWVLNMAPGTSPGMILNHRVRSQFGAQLDMTPPQHPSEKTSQWSKQINKETYPTIKVGCAESLLMLDPNSALFLCFILLLFVILRKLTDTASLKCLFHTWPLILYVWFVIACRVGQHTV